MVSAIGDLKLSVLRKCDHSLHEEHYSLTEITESIIGIGNCIRVSFETSTCFTEYLEYIIDFNKYTINLYWKWNSFFTFEIHRKVCKRKSYEHFTPKFCSVQHSVNILIFTYTNFVFIQNTSIQITPLLDTNFVY